jgi:hypothetical protein
VQIVALARRLLTPVSPPALSCREVRYLLARLAEWDVRGGGRCTWHELLQVRSGGRLRWQRVVTG